MDTLKWRKSSRSNINGGECVEVAERTDCVLARDSKDPDGPMLSFGRDEWRVFVDNVKNGTHG